MRCPAVQGILSAECFLQYGGVTGTARGSPAQLPMLSAPDLYHEPPSPLAPPSQLPAINQALGSCLATPAMEEENLQGLLTETLSKV